MARPVKETPVLKGKDAEHFEKQVKENERRSVSEEEYRRARETFRRVTSKGIL